MSDSYFRDTDWWEPIWTAFYWTLYNRVIEELTFEDRLPEDVEFNVGMSRIMVRGAAIMVAGFGDGWQDGWIDWVSENQEFEYVAQN